MNLSNTTFCRRPSSSLAAMAAILLAAGDLGAQQCEQWQSMADGFDDSALCFTVHEGDLYAGGAFTGNVARWDGSAWTVVGAGTGATVNALVSHNGDLIAGGFMPGFNHLARWDADTGTWQMFGNGVTGAANTSVRALLVYDGELIVGGNFAAAGGTSANNIARWNGSTFSPIGSGMNNTVTSLAVHSGDLYAGGHFTTAGGGSANHVARYDDAAPGKWVPLGSGIAPGETFVQALASYNGNLVVGGHFNSAGGQTVNNIAQWNGASWQNLGGGMPGLVGVFALVPYNGELIAAGTFTFAGNGLALRIARWNDAAAEAEAWQPVGDGFSDTAVALGVHEGWLTIGGHFTSTAGGVSTNHVARWRGPPLFIEHPQDVLANEGDTVILTALAVADAGPIQFQWLKGGMVIGDGGNISGSTTDALTITDVSSADFGAYSVRATAGSCSAVSAPAAVAIASAGGGTCPADLTGSGGVGVPDLLSLLANWGPCP